MKIICHILVTNEFSNIFEKTFMRIILEQLLRFISILLLEKCKFLQIFLKINSPLVRLFLS
jgi:hypothetical protein